MLILLPPSESKNPPRRGKTLDLGTLSWPTLTSAREQVLDAVVELCSQDPEAAVTTLAVPKGQPELVARNAGLHRSPTARADLVYAGVLYDALDATTLSAAARRRATSRVLIMSSLFGIIGPADRIPAYRLSGDTVLPGLGSVAGHWRAAIGEVADEIVQTGLVVDLRSSMYAAFWRPPVARASPIATVRVLHDVGGKRQVVSHFNKATKGRIVRSLLESGANPRTPSRLAEALRDLGWDVELGAATTRGTPVDVVVNQL